jgi:hypothetical protein
LFLRSFRKVKRGRLLDPITRLTKLLQIFKEEKESEEEEKKSKLIVLDLCAQEGHSFPEPKKNCMIMLFGGEKER